MIRGEFPLLPFEPAEQEKKGNLKGFLKPGNEILPFAVFGLLNIYFKSFLFYLFWKSKKYLLIQPEMWVDNFLRSLSELHSYEFDCSQHALSVVYKIPTLYYGEKERESVL